MNEEKSAAGLLGDIAIDVALLVRKELELARNELVDIVFAKLAGAWAIGIALLLAIPGILFLFIALAFWIQGDGGFGFAIVGLGTIALVVGAVAFGVGKLKSKVSVTDTLDSVKEDGKWARELLKP